MTVTLDRYSSRVRLRLIIEEHEYELAQVGSGYVIFRDAVDLPPCEAWLSLMVDGKERRKRIRLLHGAQPFDRLAQTEAC
ncbi:MAG: hypothetical protein WD066_10440 [Planctomycetaceae bacterium]